MAADFFSTLTENPLHTVHHHAVLSGSLLKTGSIYAIYRRGRAILATESQAGQSLRIPRNLTPLTFSSLCSVPLTYFAKTAIFS
jgi:hypothetical protein